MKAVNYNWVKCVNKLIELGANVNAVSEVNGTCIQTLNLCTVNVNTFLL